MGEPLFVIHDDTIAQKTKPSSQARSPIEQAGFHHSHLLGKVVWGHQVQATVLECSNLSLIHSIDLYDKSITHPDGSVYSKIDRVCDLAQTLPLPPHGGYCLVDSWFTSPCHGCVRSGRLSCHRRAENQSDSLPPRHPGFHSRLRAAHPQIRRSPRHRERFVVLDLSLRRGIECVVVLLCWPKQAFGQPKALRAFCCVRSFLGNRNHCILLCQTLAY